MIITTDVTKGGKISLFADGEFVMSIPSDIWYSLNISDYSELDEAEIDEIKAVVDERLAYAQAIRILSLRAHSSSELYKKLIVKHSSAASDAAVNKCRELGFIDDEEFARLFACELAGKKHYGIARIRQELKLKGIDGDIAAAVIDELDVDYTESILSVLEKKYKNAASDEKVRNRAVAGLKRLGFSYSDIKQALEAVDISEDGYYND